MISEREMEMLAALKGDPSYQLLLDKLQASVDSMTQKIITTFDSTERDKLVPYWQALQAVVIDLRETPEQFAQETGFDPLDDANKIENVQTQQLKDHLKEINKDRQKVKDFGWRPLKNKNKFNL